MLQVELKTILPLLTTIWQPIVSLYTKNIREYFKLQFLKKDIGENPIFGPIGIQKGINFQKSPLSSLLQNAWVMKPHRAHV